MCKKCPFHRCESNEWITQSVSHLIGNSKEAYQVRNLQTEKHIGQYICYVFPCLLPQMAHMFGWKTVRSGQSDKWIITTGVHFYNEFIDNI